MISNVLSQLDALATQVRRGKTVNVNDQQTKETALGVARAYFSDARPHLSAIGANATAIGDHDEKWQRLIRLAHGNNARTTYTKLVRSLRKELATFNVTALSTTSPHNLTKGAGHSPAQALLMETLQRLVPSAAISYQQGLLDLSAPDRLSYRGTAAELREALREVLDHLAPDREVAAQPGFKLEQNQTKPTMKQKVKFVLTSRGLNKTQREPTEKSASLVEELSGEVARAVYNRASVAAHVQESKQEVEQIRRYVDTILYDLLEIK